MDEMLTPKEAATYLRLSVYTIKEYARRGVLPAVKVGNVWRFPKAALFQWLEDRTPAPATNYRAAVARDAPETAREAHTYQGRPGLEILRERRRAASDAIDAIRLRSKPGDLQDLLDENREELRKRSERMGSEPCEYA